MFPSGLSAHHSIHKVRCGRVREKGNSRVRSVRKKKSRGSSQSRKKRILRVRSSRRISKPSFRGRSSRSRSIDVSIRSGSRGFSSVTSVSARSRIVSPIASGAGPSVRRPRFRPFEVHSGFEKIRARPHLIPLPIVLDHP